MIYLYTSSVLRYVMKIMTLVYFCVLSSVFLITVKDPEMFIRAFGLKTKILRLDEKKKVDYYVQIKRRLHF